MPLDGENQGKGHSLKWEENSVFQFALKHPTALVCSEYTSIDVNAKIAPGKQTPQAPTKN